MRSCTIDRREIDKGIIYFQLLSFLPIVGLETIYQNSMLFPTCRFLCCVISIILYINSRKISTLMIGIIFFCVWLVASTIYNGGSIVSALYGQMVVLISRCMFFEYGLRNKSKLFCECLYKYCFVLIAINLGCILLFRQGMYEDIRGVQEGNFLLGDHNSFIVTILPGLCAGYLLVKEDIINKKNYALYWVIIFATYFMERSMTSIIGVLIISCYFLFFNNWLSKIICNVFTYIVCGIGIEYFVVFRRSEGVMDLISRITGKSATFSGRTTIWDNVIPLLSKSRWIGYGVRDQLELMESMDSISGGHAHNLLLQILFQTGLIGMIIWGFILGITIYNLSKTFYSKSARFLGCIFLAWLVMLATDFYGYAAILFIIILINVSCVKINNGVLAKRKEGIYIKG